MSHAMHNFKRPHEVMRPCYLRCGMEIPALQNGVMQDRPICEGCRQELERQHRLALGQRRRGEVRTSKVA